MDKLPKAKTENIVVRNLETEVLIYDQTTNRAYCLNQTAAKVFNACDGVTTFAELKRKYQFADEIIYLTLDALQKQNLLASEHVSPFAGMNRREVIRKVGLASMIALPVISSLVAPRSSQAASNQFPAHSRKLNETCSQPNDCSFSAGAFSCNDTRDYGTPNGKRCCVYASGVNSPGSFYNPGAIRQDQCNSTASKCCSNSSKLTPVGCQCS